MTETDHTTNIRNPLPMLIDMAIKHDDGNGEIPKLTEAALEHSNSWIESVSHLIDLVASQGDIVGEASSSISEASHLITTLTRINMSLIQEQVAIKNAAEEVIEEI